MIKKALFVLVVLLVSHHLSAQYVFRKRASAIFSGRSGIETSDGGYVFTGARVLSPFQNQIIFIKTNAMGDVVWSKAYGDTLNQVGTCVIQTSDGGFAIGGYTNAMDGMNNFILLRTNDSGDLLWSKIMPVPGPEQAFYVDQTSDGGFLLGGTATFSGYQSDCFIVKTDSAGNVLWNRGYLGYEDKSFGAINKTNDNGYLLSGSNNGTSGYTGWLIKINSNGDTLWTKKYTDIKIKNAIELSTGDYAICGYTGSGISADLMVMETNSMAVPTWAKTFTQAGSDQAMDLIETSDRHLVVTGNLMQKPCLINMTPAGTLLWARNMGDSVYGEHGQGQDVYLCNDGGLLLTSAGNISVDPAVSLSLIKTDHTGYTSCYDSSYTPALTSVILSCVPAPVTILSFTQPVLSDTYPRSSVFTWTGGCSEVMSNDTLGIETPGNENFLQVYPNPFAENLFVECTSMEPNKTFSLHDLQGRMIRSGNYSGNHFQLNVTDLVSGAYVMTVSDSKNRFNKMVVKR